MMNKNFLTNIKDKATIHIFTEANLEGSLKNYWLFKKFF